MNLEWNKITQQGTKIAKHFEFWILIDFPAKIISSTCCRLEADRKIAEHQIHELQARLDEVEANALKNGKKAAAKLEARFVYMYTLSLFKKDTSNPKKFTSKKFRK